MSNIFTYVNNVIQYLTTPTQVISVVSSVCVLLICLKYNTFKTFISSVIVEVNIVNHG